MKKFLVLMLVLLVSLSSVALAKKPVRVARIPIIVQKINLDNETAKILEVKMARAVIIPLNQTLKIAEYIPPYDASDALEKIWNQMYTRNKKAEMSDALKVLASDIDADIVICPIIRHYSQRTNITGSNFETRLKSNVEVELIIYDRIKDTLTSKRATRKFNSGYNKYGTAAYLAGECFDQVIKDTKLREMMMGMRG